MNLPHERKTLDTMVRLFCSAQHGSAEPCAACAELLRYANARLDACSFGEKKPACRDCTVHCYRPEMRARIAEVMRFAGPRMLARRPVMALRHLVGGRRTPRKRG